MIRMPRVSLPIQLLLSYLLVIALGAVPIFLYLQIEMLDELLLSRAQELASQGQRLSQTLSTLHIAERYAVMTQFAVLTGERLSYIGPSGVVLFDSEADVQAMENHLARPEVQIATGQLPRPKTGIELALNGVGAARRVSETTRAETLYVALIVPPPPGRTGSGDVLRLAHRVASLHALSLRTLEFSRNSQAMAVTVAVLLSLVSALIFSRPLQQLVHKATLMAEGDFTVHFEPQRDDEVGDLAVVLDRLAVELRKRIAGSRSGEAMLAQLVEALTLPVVVVEPDGELIALNGPGRRLLHMGALEIGKIAAELVNQEEFRQARNLAEREGEPEWLELRIQGAPGERVSCLLHVLKRPGAVSLCALLGSDRSGQYGFVAPDPMSVRPMPLAEMVALSRAQVQACGISQTVHFQSSLPQVRVAEVEERLLWGTFLVLSSLRETHGQGELEARFELDPSYVTLELGEATCPAGVVLVIRALWEPIGGFISAADRRVQLRWPRA